MRYHIEDIPLKLVGSDDVVVFAGLTVGCKPPSTAFCTLAMFDGLLTSNVGSMAVP
jgi:hypothetical protein